MASAPGAQISEDELHPPGSRHLKKGKACHACRKSKMKCDATRPECNRCTHRGVKCDYDGQNETRRRGPDRQPGCRVRNAERQNSKLSRTKLQSPGASSSRNSEEASAPPPIPPPPTPPPTSYRSQPATSPPRSELSPSSSPTRVASHSPPWSAKTPPTSPFSPTNFDTSFEYEQEPASPYDEADHERAKTQETDLENDLEVLDLANISDGALVVWTEPNEIIQGPSVQFHVQTWWDRLLGFYGPNQKSAAKSVTSDLAFLFRTSDHVLSFIHLPSFFRSLLFREHRDSMQPAVTFALLAFSTLMQSSEAGRGHAGREQALILQDAAQGSLEAAISCQRIDPTLAQAALVIAIFETCPHPLYSEARCVSALRLLDQIIQALGLCYSDIDSPNVTVFPPQIAPVLLHDSPHYPMHAQNEPTYPLEMDNQHPLPLTVDHGHHTRCNCESVSFNPSTVSSMGWVGSPSWDVAWDEVKVSQEQNRRVCWSALRIISARTVQEATPFRPPESHFFIAQPSNFALLFPGESLLSSNENIEANDLTGKESIWASYPRALLLWNSCAAMYLKPVDDVDRAFFADQVMKEAEQIEATLAKHQCNTEAKHSYVGRYFLEHAKLSIKYGLQCFTPATSLEHLQYHREECIAWMNHWKTFLPQTIGRPLDKSIRPLMQRPFAVWFLIQIWERAIMLWELNPDMMELLPISIGVLNVIRAMVDLFPSNHFREVYMPLHARTQYACDATGIQIPPPVPFDELFPSEFRLDSTI